MRKRSRTVLLTSLPGQTRIAFTAQQKLQDAEDEFAEAIYRFRDAEAANATEQYALKRLMNEANAKVLGIRQCIYRG